MSLIEFQNAMSESLRDGNAPCPALVVQQGPDRQSRRFNIYRNNRVVSLIDNLQATYPMTCRLVGEDFFRAAARQFIKDQPPVGPCMTEYGSTYGDFLGEIPTTAKFPWIADMAALEWAQLCAYHAADASALSPEILATFPPEELETLCLCVHPSLSVTSSKWPVGSIWQSAAGSDNGMSVDMNQAEHVVVVRPALDVSVHVLPADGVLLLRQLKAGFPLVASVSFVTDRYPSFEPGTHLQGLFALGAFTSVHHSGESFDQRN